MNTENKFKVGDKFLELKTGEIMEVQMRGETPKLCETKDSKDKLITDLRKENEEFSELCGIQDEELDRHKKQILSLQQDVEGAISILRKREAEIDKFKEEIAINSKCMREIQSTMSAASTWIADLHSNPESK